MVPLSAAEKNDLLALARSTELRMELRATAKHRDVSFDDYIAFATSVARLSNHACRPFRPVRDSLFKL